MLNKMAKEIIHQSEEMFKKKEQTYRGKTLEDLKKLDIREFANLLKSNEKRTVMRQYGEIERFLLRFNKKIIKGKQINLMKGDLLLFLEWLDLK